MIGNAEQLLKYLFNVDKTKIFEIKEVKEKRTLTANSYYQTLLTQLSKNKWINKGDENVKLEDYSKYYIQGSGHYLIPKYYFVELFNEMENWEDECKQLKETLKDQKLIIEKLKNE